MIPVNRAWRVLSDPFEISTEGAHTVSYLLYEALLPYLGPEAASYWAHLFVVGPL